MIEKSIIKGFLTIFLLLLVFNVGNTKRINFKNYKVYQVYPQGLKDTIVLDQLDSSSDSIILLDEINYRKNSTNFVVAPHKEDDFMNLLELHQIHYNLLVDDIQPYLDNEIENNLRSDSGEYDWKSYHTLDETYNWLKDLSERYPEQVELIVGGKTYEEREILGVKVSFKPGNKGIFIEAGIHAREWIAPATATYILNELLTNPNSSIRGLAENFDFYVFPHANPDGFVYTHTTNRLWRKTRSRNGLCFGADPNRNWDFHWNEIGASSEPCSEIYAGKNAFSEIETKTLSEFISSLRGKIDLYIDFHSYSQLLMFPYGHTSKKPKNSDDLLKIGVTAARYLKQRYGTKYNVGSIYETVYPASGGSFDWVYGVEKVKLAFAYELRPNNDVSNGFILPAEQIIPTGQETLDSLLGLVRQAQELGYFNE